MHCVLGGSDTSTACARLIMPATMRVGCGESLRIRNKRSFSTWQKQSNKLTKPVAASLCAEQASKQARIPDFIAMCTPTIAFLRLLPTGSCQPPLCAVLQCLHYAHCRSCTQNSQRHNLSAFLPSRGCSSCTWCLGDLKLGSEHAI
jgi:hypothetical protein